MKAAVTTKAGAPDVIHIAEVPKPSPKNGWVIIKIKAIGLNRSELFTRKGDSPGVVFPRIQGIECVGEVEDDPSGTYKPTQKVAAIMGGMGRQFDGGYAEYTRVPFANVFPFESSLPWKILGAIPEMFQTTSGSLLQALEVTRGETLLIRGGTSSIGMLACQLGKHYGLTVISTTRNPNKAKTLEDNGADHVVLDDGQISSKVTDLYPGGVDKVLELIGADTLKDSLKCIRPRGVVCMTGILSGWTLKEFAPMDDIPRMGRLTAYTGDAENLDKALLQDFIDAVEKNTLKLNIDRYYRLDQIPEAHAYMESNQNSGKIVVEM
jgi:NADPH:quinone reductase-like Zn-dependent oxidoreductase